MERQKLRERFQEAVDEFYDTALKDPLLRDHFEALEITKLKKLHCSFAQTALGVNQTSITRQRKLRGPHRDLKITDEQYDQMLKLLRGSLEEFKFEPEFIDDVMGKMEVYRDDILNN
mmetsp:Transcript_4281/g.4793  ORF Transcript_4281/g.4793 Transcript_4281/m.4793 type:complete len:117 (+) Transcript_4281:209-559(+)